MKKEILVSVLMPNYNSEKYVGEAIESVLNQTYTNFEFIICDDCSTDGSWKIIQKYAKKDKRIKILRNEKNLGRPKTFNRLLNNISENSKYFTFIGSDDSIKNNLIEKKVIYLEKNKNISGIGSSIDYVDEKLKFIKKRIYPKYNEEIRKIFLIFSPFSQGGMLLKSELKKEKFNEKFKVCIDYEMWCRLITKGYVFGNLDESYYLHRQHKDQAKQKNLKLTILNTIKIKSKYLFKWKYFSFKALFRFCLEACLLIVPKRIILWMFYRQK
jgi:glycosyltransferase involved in cell wall biosynthesis